MKKKFFNKPAFSLVEIIVAFSVLVLVILASTNLLVSIIRSNNENENTLVAYGLAQEGVEGMRNIRDSNWLLGADFQGNIFSGAKQCLWGGCLPAGDNLGKNVFILDFKVMNIQGPAVDSYAIPDSPWILKDVTSVVQNSEKLDQITKLCVPDPNGLTAFAYHVCSNAQGEIPSLFSRFLEVEPLLYNGGLKKYRVSSVVHWNELGRPKEVRLTTELTDWKGGPL